MHLCNISEIHAILFSEFASTIACIAYKEENDDENRRISNHRRNMIHVLDPEFS